MTGVTELMNLDAPQELVVEPGRSSVVETWRTLGKIQRQQEAEKGLRGLVRISDLMDKLNKLQKVLETYDMPQEPIQRIWGHLRNALTISSTYSPAFDALLGAYEEIGECMLAAEPKSAFFEQEAFRTEFLSVVIQDFLELHEKLSHVFNQPIWQHTFGANWRSFVLCLKSYLERFDIYNCVYSGRSSRVLSNTSPITVLNIHKHIAGHVYENIALYDHAHAQIGDSFGHPNSHQNTDVAIRHQLDQLRIVVQETARLVGLQTQARTDEQYVAVRNWIGGQPFSTHHDTVYSVHEAHPATGNWILSQKEVSAWMFEDVPRKSILWLHGIPGAGKTVLSSIVIQRCLQDRDAMTFHFYCKSDDTDTCVAISIIRGLLDQALEQDKELLPYFDEWRLKSGEATLGTDKIATDLLRTVCLKARRKFIIVDGVDECSPVERERILTRLTTIVREIDPKSAGKVRLLVVSQNEPDIGRLLAAAGELRITSRHNQADIRHFVGVRASSIKDKFSLQKDQVEYIVRRTCYMANGQFLFAVLVMNNLYDQADQQALEEELRETTFPTKLSEAYDRILARMQTKMRNRTMEEKTWKILSWLSCCARPLHWRELQGAISIQWTEDVDGFKEDVNFGRYKLREHIQDICGALVTISEHGDRLSLVHSTAKRYIAESDYVDLPKATCDIAKLCMQYLCFACFDASISDGELREFLENGYFAFADYAASKWLQHFRHVCNMADLLLDEGKRDARALVLQELCEALDYFAKEYEDDFEHSQAQYQGKEVTACLSPAFLAMLDDFGGAAENFTSVWTHLEHHSVKELTSRSSITPEKLSTGIDRMRQHLEAMKPEDRKSLVEFYGTKMYKCSKTTCFYFHEGFVDKRSRNRHESGHSRPFLCVEPDCEMSDFGFTSAGDLKSHIHTFHPSIELKTNIFAPLKPVLKAEAKFECTTCGRMFVRNGILKAHALTHQGLKPHECSKCGKAFTRKNDRDRHEKIHENKRR